jgi:hypothetical protein
MKTYKIPFSYQTNAVAEVRAFTLEEAVLCVNQLINTNTSALQKLAISVSIDDATFKIEHDKVEDLNPKKSYTVKLVRTQTVEVEVEAYSTEEAEQLAIEGAEDGSLDDFSDCIDEEFVVEEVEEN